MKMKPATYVLASVLLLMPLTGSAEVVELSQNQLRALVTQNQVHSAETIATGSVARFGGAVMDIRGFLSDGKMTYRLLLQRNDGSVIEVMIDGQSGQQVTHASAMGQVVSTTARTKTQTRASDMTKGNASYGSSASNSRSDTARTRNNSNRSSSNRNENAQSNSNRSNRGNSNANSNRNNGNGNAGNSNRGGNGNGNGNGKRP